MGLVDLEKEVSCDRGNHGKNSTVNVPAGRGKLTLMEMVSDFEKVGLRIESDRRNRRGNQKPLPIL